MRNLKHYPEVSVVLPIHITHESQFSLFERALASIAKQKNIDTELIVTSHELDDRVLKILRNYASRINYQLYEQAPLGISKNTNFAVSKANGVIVKILYQDDYLLNRNALRRIWKKLKKSNSKWYVTASKHIHENERKAKNKIIPTFNPLLLQGINRVSSPSVSAFYRSFFVPFSEDLNLLLDCEWYVRMVHYFGMPYIDSRVNVVNGVHSHQAQRKYAHLMESEKLIANNMHSNLDITDIHMKQTCKCVAKDGEKTA